MDRRRVAVLGAASVVVVLLGGLSVFLVVRGARDPATPPGATAPSPSGATASASASSGMSVSSGAPVPPLSSASASAIASGLAAGTDEGVRSVVAVPSGQTLDRGAAEALAQVGPVTFDLSTFHGIADGQAAVAGEVAHPPAGQSSRWTFYLVLVDGAWRIASAEPGP
jgi:hypothetical protein